MKTLTDDQWEEIKKQVGYLCENSQKGTCLPTEEDFADAEKADDGQMTYTALIVHRTHHWDALDALGKVIDAVDGE